MAKVERIKAASGAGLSEVFILLCKFCTLVKVDDEAAAAAAAAAAIKHASQ